MGQCIARNSFGAKNYTNFAIKKMSFIVAFGHEAVIPIEIGVSTLRVSHFVAASNDERLREDLDLIKKVRDEAQVRAAARRQ